MFERRFLAARQGPDALYLLGLLPGRRVRRRHRAGKAKCCTSLATLGSRQTGPRRSRLGLAARVTGLDALSGPTPPWVPSTDGFPCASARSGRSPRPRARLRFPSATPLASREGLHRPGGVLLRGPLSRTRHRQLASARQRFRLRLPTNGAVGPFLGKRAFWRPIGQGPGPPQILQPLFEPQHPFGRLMSIGDRGPS